MAGATCNKKNAPLTSKLDSDVMKKVVGCYTWIIDFYGVKTWTLREVD
jgi:hypothetical protein